MQIGYSNYPNGSERGDGYSFEVSISTKSISVIPFGGLTNPKYS
jgi:hypothetical protein